MKKYDKPEPNYTKGIFLILLSAMLLLIAIMFGSCGIAMLRLATG